MVVTFWMFWSETPAIFARLTLSLQAPEAAPVAALVAKPVIELLARPWYQDWCWETLVSTVETSDESRPRTPPTRALEPIRAATPSPPSRPEVRLLARAPPAAPTTPLTRPLAAPMPNASKKPLAVKSRPCWMSYWRPLV